MFAGIIEHKAKVRRVDAAQRIQRVRIEKPRSWRLAIGQSININGVCSTVVKRSESWFDVEYMPETIRKTSAGALSVGSTVNLERSLKYGQRIDGHPVQGHVDITAPIVAVVPKGKSREITIKPSAKLARHASPHGSIAINGVGLTVAKKHGPNITVALIPHTLRSTNLGSLTAGDMVNVEFDHTADYLAALRDK